MKSKQRIFWKVVRKARNNTLNSAIIQIKGVSLNYRVGKWTTPKIKGSKILVFKTLAAAKDFARAWHGKFIVFRCQGTNPTKVIDLLGYTARKRKDNITVFWNDPKKAAWLRTMFAPEKTVSVDKVKLLK